jgi:hypothetical protein
LKLIDLDQVPRRRTRDPNEKLLSVLHRIPKGKVLVITEADLENLDVSSVHAVRVAVKRYVSKSLIPETIKATQRVRHGKKTVYIMNPIE